MIQPGKRGSLLAPLVKDNLPASKGSSGRHFLTPEETPHVRSRRERTEHTKRREDGHNYRSFRVKVGRATALSAWA